MKAKQKSYLLLTLTVFVWASSYTITKGTVNNLSPILFAFLRFVVASAVILLMSIGKPQPPRFFREHYKSILLLAVTGVTLYYLFFNYAFIYTTASAGALIQGFIPVAVVMLAAVFLKERLTKFQLLGIVLSVVGVVVMAMAGHRTGTAINPLKGNLLMLASVFLWASYTVISKKVQHADARWLTIYSTVIGTLLMIPMVIYDVWGHPLPFISVRDWVSIIYLGTFASALSYYWYNSSLKSLSASTVGVFLNIDPMIGAIIAILFLGEPFFWLQGVGMLLILVGVAFNSSKS